MKSDSPVAEQASIRSSKHPRRIVFYKLISKVVSMEEDLSQKSRDIAYYTLSIGHHTGILDCFSEAISCSYTEFEQLMDAASPDSYLYIKFNGLRRFGEIHIEKAQAAQLLESIAHCSNHLPKSRQDFVIRFTDLLYDVVHNRALYLIGRRLS